MPWSGGHGYQPKHVPEYTIINDRVVADAVIQYQLGILIQTAHTDCLRKDQAIDEAFIVRQTQKGISLSSLVYQWCMHAITLRPFSNA
jgi:hypothetical protein